MILIKEYAKKDRLLPAFQLFYIYKSQALISLILIFSRTRIMKSLNTFM